MLGFSNRNRRACFTFRDFCFKVINHLHQLRPTRSVYPTASIFFKLVKCLPLLFQLVPRCFVLCSGISWKKVSETELRSPTSLPKSSKICFAFFTLEIPHDWMKWQRTYWPPPIRLVAAGGFALLHHVRAFESYKLHSVINTLTTGKSLRKFFYRLKGNVRFIVSSRNFD